MKLPLKKGLYFGQTSAIMTSLGIIVGMFSSTGSVGAILGGLLVISFADALSDSFGIHVSEEAEKRGGGHEWKAMGYTFLSKFVFSLSFIALFLLLDVWSAVLLSVAWGFFVLGLSSFYLAKTQSKNPLKIVLEHLLIGIVVVVFTYYIGVWVNLLF